MRETLPAVRRVLHVLNGDATREPLERAGVAGTFVVWPDVLHDGPCRLVDAAEWRRMRSRFLAGGDRQAEAAILEDYAARDRQLAGYADADEVVFWFEHDLFDQLLLIRHLHWLSSLPASDTVFSLICIDAFPGVPRFAGLGQLTAEQLATLFPRRQPITAAQRDLGVTAWERFCAADPSELVDLLADDTSALPFLAGALQRFLADYPSTGSGLARSERQILAVVAAGADTPRAAFRATQDMEERIFMGDWSWWDIARRLASAHRPLLAIDGPRDTRSLPEARLRLTDDGGDVLAGRADHVALNGIDRWMGGVRLTSDRWRWTGRTLVPVA